MVSKSLCAIAFVICAFTMNIVRILLSDGRRDMGDSKFALLLSAYSILFTLWIYFIYLFTYAYRNIAFVIGVAFSGILVGAIWDVALESLKKLKP